MSKFVKTLFSSGFPTQHYEDKSPFVIRYSPCGAYVAVAKGEKLELWREPVFGNPCALVDTFHMGCRIDAIDWHPSQSRMLVGLESGEVHQICRPDSL